MSRNLLIGLLLLVPVALHADGATLESGAALGAHGEVYLVRAGHYADLFPSGNATAADSNVLALEIRHPDSTAERFLVPRTDDAASEPSFRLVLDSASQTPFVLWESWSGLAQVQLNLVSRTPEGWSDVIEISGNPFAFKKSPQLVVTHDQFEMEEPSGEITQHERTILHLVWLEYTAGGVPITMYAPVVLEDGAYLGWNPVYSLNDLIESSAAAQGLEINAALFETATIQHGGDSQSVVIGFADPSTDQLVSFELRVLPGELSSLADDVRAHLIEIGARYVPGDQKSLNTLADAVRAHLIEIGNRLHISLVDYLADESQALIKGADPHGDLSSLADAVRAHLIELGARMDRGRLARTSAGVRAHLIEIGYRSTGGSAPHNQIEMRIASQRLAPETGSGPTAIYLSRSGEDALVAWQDDQTIRYRETTASGWSDVQTLPLGPDDDIATAYDLLANRIRSR